MVALDSRKGRILQAIINEYVHTAEPVGSDLLVLRYDFGCKSATLRNEMAEMSERGYLRQPHTSAGRIPSNLGYRYYVDCLMLPNLPDAARRKARAAEKESRTEVEEILQLTCRMLADMTHYPSVATPPLLKATTMHRLYLTPASPRHLLLVMLLSTGHIEHKLLEIETIPSNDTLQTVTNYLQQRYENLELEMISSGPMDNIPSEMMNYRPLLQTVHHEMTAALRSLFDNRLFLEGANHILRLREFQDVLRMDQLLSLLEQRNILFQALCRASLGQDVTVVIGDESHVEQMQECSLVTSRYHIRERTAGYIGVVGPTRMNYDRAVAAVSLMAGSLSTMLTRASLS